MRTFLVLLALAVLVVPMSAVEKTSPGKRMQSAADSEQNIETTQTIPVRPRLKLDQSRENDVCYTMHTLQVAREQGTDITRLVRQRTCTPSQQFEMKSTVQRSK